MSPVDALRVEHDLIRRVVAVLERQSARVGEDREVDAVLLERITDFVHTYVERVHHGKEEEILFRALDDKPLSSEHRQMMEALVRDHVEMRHLVEDLLVARDSAVRGDEQAVAEVQEIIERLSDVYPQHFTTEEEMFFPAVSSYADDAEQEAILEAMRGHDRAMIHQRYAALVEDLEAAAETWELTE